MKKIINNKMYNTETAKYIAEFSEGTGRGFSDFTESLYQKKTGEFFIYGSGGPMSKYSKHTGENTWSGSSDIEPLTPDDVKDWLSSHGYVDEYIALFGELDE